MADPLDERIDDIAALDILTGVWNEKHDQLYNVVNWGTKDGPTYNHLIRQIRALAYVLDLLKARK